jgi:CRP/FNR family cyclic AMP-dependent transcriptional regulator
MKPVKAPSLTCFDTIQFMHTVLGDREAGRTWTKVAADAARTHAASHCIDDGEAARRPHPASSILHPAKSSFAKATSADYVFSLFEGETEVLVDNVVVGHISEGEIIGALAVLTDQPRSATVRAKVRCSVVKVPKDQFALLIRSNPAMIHSLLVDMAKHIMRLNKQVVTLSARL